MPKIVTPKATGQCPVGVGVDLVQIDAFAQQLSEPGTSFSQRAFSPRELRQAQARVRARGAEPNWQELAPKKLLLRPGPLPWWNLKAPPHLNR